MRVWPLILHVAAAVISALPGKGMARGDIRFCGDLLVEPVSASQLEGSLVCAHTPGGADDPNQRWSEMHYADGTLGEWGRGSEDPSGSYKPSVGTWSYPNSNNTVTYTYGSNEYTWSLYGPDSDTPTALCDSSNTRIAVILRADPIPSDATLKNPCGW